MNDNTPSSALIDPQVKPTRPTFNEWLKVAQAGEEFVYYLGRGLGDATPEEEAEAKAALQAFADDWLNWLKEESRRAKGQSRGNLSTWRRSATTSDGPQCSESPFALACLQCSTWR
jgi:hypothetical protein